MDKEELLIDVRTREEFVMGHVMGAISIPHYDLDLWKGFLSTKAITVYCNTGHRSEIAKRRIEAMGFPCELMDPEVAEAKEWTSGEMICAANFIELKPGDEEAFREKAMQLCRATEDFEGFPLRKDFPLQGTVGGRIRVDLRGKI